MKSLDTSKTGTAEYMMDGNASIPHGLSHQFSLDSTNYCERTVSAEALGTLAPLWDLDRHVEVLALVATLLVKAVGDPGTEGEVDPLSMSSDEELSGSRGASGSAGADPILLLNIMTGLHNLGIQTLYLQVVVRSIYGDTEIIISP